MIDPEFITCYAPDLRIKQQQLIFWVLAAGKNGTTTARLMIKLFKTIDPEDCLYPFDAILGVGFEHLPQVLKDHGIGCYKNKSRTLWELSTSNINLFTCTPDDLEKIYGIGMKTSRCFILHSRKEAYCAGLDVHMLRFLREKGHHAPFATPSGRRYRELEQIVLNYAKESGKTPAEFDLSIWNKYKVKSTPVAQ